VSRKTDKDGHPDIEEEQDGAAELEMEG